jgi:cold shock CspA family protein
MSSGKITSWKDDRGFGFISTPLAKKDVFVHISSFPKYRRKPQVGDTVNFELSEKNGKPVAIKCTIVGLTPTQRRTKRTNQKTNNVFKLAILIFIIILGVYQTKLLHNTTSNSSSSARFTPAIESSIKFKCDGRQYCSQMRSYEEALFFIRNCPDTKMDGDNDGDPCESQF